MRLATSTNILFKRPDGTSVPLEFTLLKASEAGFKLFDLNFYDWSLPGSPFLTDNWEVWINSIRQTAEDLGVQFGQCHVYFYNFLDNSLSNEDRARHMMLQERSIECCKIIGAHTCVMHPETKYDAIDYYKQSFNANKNYFNNVLDVVSKKGMRVAIENMCDYGIAPARKFCAYPEELIDFIDSFRSESIGVCWDFEHAEIMGQDQTSSLRLIGKRLIATHVSDTYSKTDNTLMHVLPLTSKINWAPIMQELKRIEYLHDFAFEVHNYLNRLPDSMIESALSFAYGVGCHLINLSLEETKPN